MSTNWHNEAVLFLAERPQMAQTPENLQFAKMAMIHGATLATADAKGLVDNALKHVVAQHDKNVTPDSGQTKLVEVPDGNSH